MKEEKGQYIHIGENNAIQILRMVYLLQQCFGFLLQVKIHQR